MCIRDRSMIDRAAQFSPFAALTGYDAAVKETARLTDSRIELDEYEKVALDEKLRIALEHPEAEITILYFKPVSYTHLDVYKRQP